MLSIAACPVVLRGVSIFRGRRGGGENCYRRFECCSSAGRNRRGVCENDDFEGECSAGGSMRGSAVLPVSSIESQENSGLFGEALFRAAFLKTERVLAMWWGDLDVCHERSSYRRFVAVRRTNHAAVGILAPGHDFAAGVTAIWRSASAATSGNVRTPECGDLCRSWRGHNVCRGCPDMYPRKLPGHVGVPRPRRGSGVYPCPDCQLCHAGGRGRRLSRPRLAGSDGPRRARNREIEARTGKFASLPVPWPSVASDGARSCARCSSDRP